MTSEATKRKLRLTTIVYWVLLVYIIAALFWWYFSLHMQTETLYRLQKEKLMLAPPANSAAFREALTHIEEHREKETAKYIGEGITFLVLIFFGAVYIYRSVRKQFRVQQQQQNFVMAITHELKTPIAVSRLNLETLQRHHLDEEKKRKLLQMTLQENLRLDGLINNILISSQLEGHSYHRTAEELNLSDLVNDVSCQFITRYPDRSLQRTLAADIDLTGDPLLLKLLLSNLLENANKYSPRDKPIQVRLSENASRILLEVVDEGPGIAPSERKNVFHKFYRIGNEETRTAKGTGLGLYLCKKIAEGHGGNITINDNQPQGSNFTVSFYK